jgi:hypothetical protein
LLVAISVSFYSKFGIYGEVLKDKKEEGGRQGDNG